jgi:hypothetical protein
LGAFLKPQKKKKKKKKKKNLTHSRPGQKGRQEAEQSRADPGAI